MNDADFTVKTFRQLGGDFKVGHEVFHKPSGHRYIMKEVIHPDDEVAILLGIKHYLLGLASKEVNDEQ